MEDVKILRIIEGKLKELLKSYNNPYVNPTIEEKILIEKLYFAQNILNEIEALRKL